MPALKSDHGREKVLRFLFEIALCLAPRRRRFTSRPVLPSAGLLEPVPLQPEVSKSAFKIETSSHGLGGLLLCLLP